MLRKKIVIGKEAREKLLEGAKLMADCVTCTLGPKGRNVGLQRPWGAPTILHDGVSVAREVASDDEFVQMGISYIKEAAEKTVQSVGDATTTSTLLSYKLIDGGIKLLDTGSNPMVLRDQIYQALPKLLDVLNKKTIAVKSQKDIERVAAISSADPLIGKFVGEAVYKLGKTGLVSVDESYTSETSLIYTDGMQWDKGYTDAVFVTNPGRMEAVVTDPYILVTDKQITGIGEILPTIESLAQKGMKSIVVIGSISGLALEFLAKNKYFGNIKCLVVDAEGIQERHEQNLQDIALLVGARLLHDELSVGSNNFDPSFCGRAKSVVATKDTTAIIEGKGEKTIIEKRVAELKEYLETATAIHQKEILQERIARLTTGAAVVKVGGRSEMEIKERLERVKDAIGAAQAAMDEGIVAGGGITFIKLAKAIKNQENEAEVLLYSVLQSVTRKLLQNAGVQEPEEERILKAILGENGNKGYNIATGSFEDLVVSGVIDPAKAIRMSLENAISVATSVITCEGLIAIKSEDDPQKQQNEI